MIYCIIGVVQQDDPVLLSTSRIVFEHSKNHELLARNQMSKKTTMKTAITAGLILVLAAAFFVSAGAAAPTLGIELEYGDYNEGTYTGYVVLKGVSSTDTFQAAKLNLTATNGVNITDVQKSDDLKVTPNKGKVADDGSYYNFNMYTSNKVVSEGVKLVKFTVDVTEAASFETAEINITSFVGGDAASDIMLQISDHRYNTSDVIIEKITLKAVNPHSFESTEAIDKSLNVEDNLNRSDLASDIGTIYSELGTPLDLASLNLSIEVVDPLSTVYIETDNGNFTSVTGLHVEAVEKAVGKVGVWNNDAEKLVDTRDVTFIVEQKTDLEHTFEDPVVNYTGISYVKGTDIIAQILEDLSINNHNIGKVAGKPEGFAREITVNDLELTFDPEVTDEFESGSYNFTVTIPTLNNYGTVTLTNNSYYCFTVSGEQSPDFDEIGNAFDGDLLKIGQYANMSMSYGITDYENVKLANVSAVKKFYVNKSYLNDQPEHAASMILENCAAANESFVDMFTYDKTTGKFTFKDEAAQTAPENGTYVFYLTSQYKLGDVNTDGVVDSGDAAFICNKLVEENPDWTVKQIFYGKTTGGYYNPTVLDALRIAQFELGTLYS